jgi:hypothetical protein
MSRLVPDRFSSEPLYDDFSTMYTDFTYSPSIETKLVSPNFDFDKPKVPSFRFEFLRTGAPSRKQQ